MTKLELATEIYQIDNQIREFKGEQPVDLTMARFDILEFANKNAKYSLENRLSERVAYLERLQAEKELKDKTEAFYATPEGLILKSELESGIEAKIEEWKALEISSRDALEHLIQEYLGDHWGVTRMSKGYASIGVIDTDKSTLEQRAFYFGQEIDLRYESRNWLSGGEERFESSCGSTGSFDMNGGQTVGQRAMFYAGIGQLYANATLVQTIKDVLRNSESETERISTELDALRKQLKNPTNA